MSEPSALTQSPILPTFIRLSVLNIFAVVAMALISIAETTYMGALGTAPLAGMALIFPLFMLQQMLSSGAMGAESHRLLAALSALATRPRQTHSPCMLS
jgi:hypothetical protein